MNTPVSDRADELVIKTFKLTRQFGSLVAVDHIDLAVAYREILGLLGANGAGKSTMINRKPNRR
ncbi:MAG: ATP-binding cassette domain-containing protein [Methylococcaceae bacterium]|nr:ATP-binding cassette domain-containing protein [Methylococcaceae bacterium]